MIPFVLQHRGLKIQAVIYRVSIPFLGSEHNTERKKAVYGYSKRLPRRMMVRCRLSCAR